ncbi:2OG-Fe dioxygenase family protein [Nonomuraea jiangxiensis]|nr:2OG-Fe dioxygenase family protein [Nonomuraea jiangxiensis]
MASDGYCLVPGSGTRVLLGAAYEPSLADWNKFTSSWFSMPIDEHMADHGRYRRRRHATLSMSPGSVTPKREAHRPHYQSLDYNVLNGGVERLFEPIEIEVMTGDVMSNLLILCGRIVAELEPDRQWHIEVHQFRIEVDDSGRGLPTPEGRHRDGVDFAIMVMVNLSHAAGGTTTISDAQGNVLDTFRLADPLDMAIVDDRRVFHGVHPIERDGSGMPAYRDVLVVTFVRVSP